MVLSIVGPSQFQGQARIAQRDQRSGDGEGGGQQRAASVQGSVLRKMRILVAKKKAGASRALRLK